jgi:Immunity protein 31
MGGSNPRYEFYEVVQVISQDESKAKLNGQTGAVLGRAQADDGKSWSYAVAIDSTEIVWSFDEDELLPTGLVRKREDYYDGSSVRVIVDEEGRGQIAP